ncbi:D-tyrosyl-tRNA(Tyr) deacylase [bacterium]|nr:D-tyrosyl-tRNA(Tyr) deacylase [bacterium]
MKIVLQRVCQASVEIDNEVVSEINEGYLLLIGFERGDDSRFINPMIDKILKIKLFPDSEGRFAYSLEERKGELLAISQFTLFADLKKGKKPSLSKALDPEKANTLYNEFFDACIQRNISIKGGVFGAYMQVHLQNDGPVTIILDSKELLSSLY